MKNKHPIVSVTGASGAGTTVVQKAFREIFHRQGMNAAFVEGDSFFKYEYDTMCQMMDEAKHNGTPFSCYGPDMNDFHQMEALFKEYSEHGTGKIRHRVNMDNFQELNQQPGTFTDWENLPDSSDLLIYEGLHGGVVADSWTRRKIDGKAGPAGKDRRDPNRNKGVNIAQYVDLMIGVVPAINLEWIQKMHRDMDCQNMSREDVTGSILESMQDYIHFIVPQFSLTDINFQRMPVVDTSNPFIAREVPVESESVIVVRFREPKKYNFPYFLKRIHGAFMSRPNTIVIPGGEMKHALDVICAPIIESCCNLKAGCLAGS
ncbi:MAG: phosphoribulokinase [Gammaproteobacteria bacterium]